MCSVNKEAIGRHGNYCYSFIINNKLIPEAFLPENKVKETPNNNHVSFFFEM